MIARVYGATSHPRGHNTFDEERNPILAEVRLVVHIAVTTVRVDSVDDDAVITVEICEAPAARIAGARNEPSRNLRPRIFTAAFIQNAIDLTAVR